MIQQDWSEILIWQAVAGQFKTLSRLACQQSTELETASAP